MRYLAIALFAVAMSLGGMSSPAEAGHMKHHMKTWVVKETPHGLKWYKFDKRKHMKKHWRHHHRMKHWRHHHHKHCMKHKCMHRHHHGYGHHTH